MNGEQLSGQARVERASEGGIDILGTIREAIRICYSRPGTFLGMAAVVFLPSLVLSLLNMARDADDLFKVNPIVGLLSLISIVAAFIFGIYYAGAINVLTAYSLDERPLTWTEAFSWVTNRRIFWSIFLVGLLYVFVVIGGLILCIIPGIIFATWFMLAIPALVLHGDKGSNALSTSHDLLRGVFWEALGFGILLVLPIWIPIWIAQGITAPIWGFFSFNPIRVTVPAVVTYLASVFWSPVIAVGVALLYIERVGGLPALRSDLFL